MGRIGRVIFMVVAAAIGAGVVTALVLKPASAPGPKDGQTQDMGRPAMEKTVVHLYFGDTHGAFLSAEKRVLENNPDPADYARSLILALLDGPKKDGVRCIPEGVRLNAVYVVDSTAFVDLSGEVNQGQPGGAGAEFMTVFSLVNTLCLNVADISAVKILIQGQEAPTLAGHVDIRFPFGADMTIIR